VRAEVVEEDTIMIIYTIGTTEEQHYKRKKTKQKKREIYTKNKTITTNHYQ